MSEPILDPAYWRNRLYSTPVGHEHQAVFKCSLEKWRAIERKHKEILARHIQRHDAILDAGCGWGRLLTLLPRNWDGSYLGIDLSPDFIRVAHLQSSGRRFEVGDLRDLSPLLLTPNSRDWAILISIRPMIRRNLGGETWDAIEKELRKYAKRLMYLEYDETDEGEIA